MSFARLNFSVNSRFRTKAQQRHPSGFPHELIEIISNMRAGFITVALPLAQLHTCIFIAILF